MHRFEPVYCFRGGIGDELLLSVVARELKRRDRPPLTILSRHPSLFRRNPNLGQVIPYGRIRYLRHRFFSHRLFELAYTRYVAEKDADHIPPTHISALLCAFVGLEGKIETHPELFLTEDESHREITDTPRICIHTSGRSSKFPIPNKEWYFERFQTVVDALRSEALFVQLGSPADPLLVGVQDLRGRTTIRESAAILAGSRLFVGLQGFLMHLSRAVSCPAVVVYGGRERPDQSGYSCFTNLVSNSPCAPCWQWSRCDYNRQCMRDIEPEAVIEAIRQSLAVPRSSLRSDTIDIDPVSGNAWRTFLFQSLRGKPHLQGNLFNEQSFRQSSS
jgi:ADP-heptose:LPS heptosyltransferase